MATGMVSSMVTSTTDKVRENRLRRMAERQGFALRKKRRRDRRALDYGEIWLMRVFVETPSGVEAIANPQDSDDAWLGPFRSLDELEGWLNSEPETRPDLEARRAAGEYWLDEMRQRKAGS
jgi:hypothetical protein